jgi:hypothetical protein
MNPDACSPFEDLVSKIWDEGENDTRVKTTFEQRVFSDSIFKF